jgi:hypothetical protein
MAKIFKPSEYPNVTIEPDVYTNLKKRAPEWDGSIKFSTTLGEVFESIYVKNPTWRFLIERPYYLMEGQAAEMRTINVTCGGEAIGSLYSEYFRGDYGVEIRNERIPNGRIRTSDSKRAITAVKKHFVKRNVQERLQKAVEAAVGVMDHQHSRVVHPLLQVKNDLMKSMFKFVMKNYRTEYEAMCNVHETPALTLLADYDKKFADMTTIEEVRSKYTNKQAVLVVLDQGKYIVKTGDNVQLFDDNDLPVQIRGRLGLLKLVEDKQMVTDTGCRVSDEVFVVVLDTEGEAT